MIYPLHLAKALLLGGSRSGVYDALSSLGEVRERTYGIW